MRTEDWMQRQVHCVRPLDSMQHARELMAAHRINQMPVVVDGKIVGIITDRDLRDAFPSVFECWPHTRMDESNAPVPKQVTVEMVMTPNVLTLDPKAPLAEAARLMRRERIGAIPVVDGERLVGIVTRSDVLDAFVALTERQATGDGQTAAGPKVPDKSRKPAKP